MDDVQNRLINCFETVFPDLSVIEITQSSQSTLSAWDSIAVITLVNVIDEEFGFQVDFDRLPELDSYDRILSYIRGELQR
jgi:acyl carrier protein